MPRLKKTDVMLRDALSRLRAAFQSPPPAAAATHSRVPGPQPLQAVPVEAHVDAGVSLQLDPEQRRYLAYPVRPGASRYPAAPPAVRAIAPAELLEEHAALITTIRDSLPLTLPDFDRLVRPTLLRTAEWWHLLPASETHHHSEIGGGLRHSLEVAMHAARGADGRKLASHLTPSKQVHYQRRWQVATMFAGLLHDLGKPLVDLRVTDPDGERTWQPARGSLWEWLQIHQLPCYYFYWEQVPRGTRHQSAAVELARDVLGPETRAFLAEDDTDDIWSSLRNVLGSKGELPGAMGAVAGGADRASVDAYESARRAKPLYLQTNHPSALQVRVLHVLRRRLETGAWRVGQEGPLHWNGERLAAYFPDVMTVIAADLRLLGDRAFPHERADFARALADAGFFEVPQGGAPLAAPVFNMVVPGSGQPARRIVLFTRHEGVLEGTTVDHVTPFRVEKVGDAPPSPAEAETAPAPRRRGKAKFEAAPPVEQASLSFVEESPTATSEEGAPPEIASPSPDPTTPVPVRVDAAESEEANAAAHSLDEHRRALVAEGAPGLYFDAALNLVLAGRIRHQRHFELLDDGRLVLAHPLPFAAGLVAAQSHDAHWVKAGWMDPVAANAKKQYRFEQGERLPAVLLTGAPAKAFAALADLYPAVCPENGEPAVITNGLPPIVQQASRVERIEPVWDPAASDILMADDPMPADEDGASAPTAEPAEPNPGISPTPMGLVPDPDAKPASFEPDDETPPGVPPLSTVASSQARHLDDAQAAIVRGYIHRFLARQARASGLDGPQAFDPAEAKRQLIVFARRYGVSQSVVCKAVVSEPNALAEAPARPANDFSFSRTPNGFVILDSYVPPEWAHP
jgi:hypothetical protein